MSTDRPVFRSKSRTAAAGSWRAPITGVTPHHAPQDGTRFADTVQFFGDALPDGSSPAASSPSVPAAHAARDAASVTARKARAAVLGIRLSMAAHYNDPCL